MSYIVSREDIMSVTADAAAVSIENTMKLSEEPVSQRLGICGGAEFLAALKEKRFLPVGKAWSVPVASLPFRCLFAVGTPQWRYGECNEYHILRRCYRSLFDLASQYQCHSLALPFLSAAYYRFPVEEAVRIGLEEAKGTELEIIFLAQNKNEYELSLRPYTKPKLLDYLGYYHDHAVFQLDNGQFAFIDRRPELRDVSIRLYARACYYLQSDPFLPPLSKEEIERLRRIYEEC